MKKPSQFLKRNIKAFHMQMSCKKIWIWFSSKIHIKMSSPLPLGSIYYAHSSSLLIVWKRITQRKHPRRPSPCQQNYEFYWSFIKKAKTLINQKRFCFGRLHVSHRKIFQKDTKTYFNGSHPPPPQNTRMVSACIIIPSISVFIKTH